MKKILGLTIALVLMVSAYSFAYQGGEVRQVYSYYVENDTSNALTTIIPVTSIRPNVDKIVGYDLLPLNPGNNETFVGLFDGTDEQLSGECFGEKEAVAGGSANDYWPRGKKIVDGVVTRQGTNTVLQLLFIRQ